MILHAPHNDVWCPRQVLSSHIATCQQPPIFSIHRHLFNQTWGFYWLLLLLLYVLEQNLKISKACVNHRPNLWHLGLRETIFKKKHWFQETGTGSAKILTCFLVLAHTLAAHNGDLKPGGAQMFSIRGPKANLHCLYVLRCKMTLGSEVTITDHHPAMLRLWK